MSLYSVMRKIRLVLAIVFGVPCAMLFATDRQIVVEHLGFHGYQR